MIKIIALCAMTVDHAGAILFDRPELATLIGRIAFPAFACLVGVNVLRTSRPFRYLGYLLAFGMISHVVVTWSLDRYPLGLPLNIMFTLFLGAFLSVILFRPDDTVRDRPVITVFNVGIIFLALYFSAFVEYGLPGVMLIVFTAFTYYAARSYGWACLVPLAACFFLAWLVNGGVPEYSIIAVLAYFLTGLFIIGGDRRVGDRLFFYAYYPLHLLVLAGFWPFLF